MSGTRCEDRTRRVLLVSLRSGWHRDIAAWLEGKGYVVDTAEDAALVATRAPHDLVVVDLPPAPDAAIGLCTALRAEGSQPIIAVARHAAREASLLAAYEAGADLVLVGPLSEHELVARVRATLRRCPFSARGPECDGVAGGESTVIELDPTTRTALVGGRKVDLRAPEADLLGALLRRPGSVVTREELRGGILGGMPDPLIDSVVRRLRSKLEAAEGRRRIVAVRGVGFRLLAGS